MRTSQEGKADRLARLAQRIVRHERLKIMRGPRNIMQESEDLIAGTIEAVGGVDGKALSSGIESVLFADFREQFGNTTCFNCEKISCCILKFDACLDCDSFDHGGSLCVEPDCGECLSREFRTNAHLDCPEYRLDRGSFCEALRQKEILVAALADRYGIHEGRISRRIDSLLQEFENAIGAGRPVFPLCRSGN